MFWPLVYVDFAPWEILKENEMQVLLLKTKIGCKMCMNLCQGPVSESNCRRGISTAISFLSVYPISLRYITLQRVTDTDIQGEQVGRCISELRAYLTMFHV